LNLFGGFVEEPSEVKPTVNNVEAELLGKGGIVLRCGARGELGADGNIASMVIFEVTGERHDVGDFGIAKKIEMELGAAIGSDRKEGEITGRSAVAKRILIEALNEPGNG